MSDRPNLLLVLTDQLRYPPSYESEELTEYRREHCAGQERLRANSSFHNTTIRWRRPLGGPIRFSLPPTDCRASTPSGIGLCFSRGGAAGRRYPAGTVPRAYQALAVRRNGPDGAPSRSAAPCLKRLRPASSSASWKRPRLPTPFANGYQRSSKSA